MSNAYELKLAPWTPWTSRPWPPRRWTRPVPSWELRPPTGVCPVTLCPGGHGQPAGGLQPPPSPRTRPRRGCPGWQARRGDGGLCRRHPGGRPFCPLSAMPMPFDAEGTPARKKNVIEAGRLNTLLYNHRTAAAAGKETTGNASKSSYDAPVDVAPSPSTSPPASGTRRPCWNRRATGCILTLWEDSTPGPMWSAATSPSRAPDL